MLMMRAARLPPDMQSAADADDARCPAVTTHAIQLMLLMRTARAISGQALRS